MKMSTADYSRLQNAILKAEIRVTTIADYHAKHPEFSATRVRWDFFHLACNFDTRLSPDFYNRYKDEHIETALRLIIPDWS